MLVEYSDVDYTRFISLGELSRVDLEERERKERRAIEEQLRTRLLIFERTKKTKKIPTWVYVTGGGIIFLGVVYFILK